MDEMISPKGFLRTPPGPPGLPILGVIPQVAKSPLQFFLRMALSYGDVVRLDMGRANFYLISHPEQIKYILQDNNRNYTKGYDKAKPLLGEGLVTSDGSLWMRQRRLMQPAFGRPQVADLLPIMSAAAEEMMARWDSRPHPEAPLDIAAEMMLLTQTIILRSMFSKDIGVRAQEAAQAFSTTLEYLNTILLSPFSFTDVLPTPTNLRFHRALKTLNAIIFDIIAERRRKPSDRQDLLDLMMQARDPETGEGMSDQQMRDEIMTIFLAGHETTATLLAWTWYLLALHPLIERLALAEFQSVLAGRALTSDDLNRLPYTRQVLDETLRLYPPAWMFARRPVNDDELGGYHIPAGSMVMLSPYITHRLPAFWQNPEGFDPERFSPQQSAGRPRYAYFPFSGGPRQCIGMTFALMEAQLILAAILQNFQMELEPGRIVTPQPVATLRPRPGVFMRLRRR